MKQVPSFTANKSTFQAPHPNLYKTGGQLIWLDQTFPTEWSTSGTVFLTLDIHNLP